MKKKEEKIEIPFHKSLYSNFEKFTVGWICKLKDKKIVA